MNIHLTTAIHNSSLWKKVAKNIPGAVQIKKYSKNLFSPFITSTKDEINPYMARPFLLNDLKDIPAGWRVGNGPDFVGISASKSGTTWWYSLLKKHPQIVQNRLNRKELSYFPHFKYFGLNDEQILAYRMAFAAPEGSICGEWSPGYLSNPFCTEYLKEAAPKTKLLILLRNPIDRILSSLNHKSQGRVKYFNLSPEQQYVYEVFEMRPAEIKGCLYALPIKQLLKHFNRDQILVLQYEKCKIDPLQEIACTYRFLGIDDQYQPENIKRQVNKKEYFVSPLTSKERQRLAAYLIDDVQTISELLPEIDLNLWPDF